jgi:hypothetical protein
MERLGSLRMALPVLGPGSGEAARLEELEVLSLGIEGKRMLWRVLGALASSDGRLVGFDFADANVGPSASAVVWSPSGWSSMPPHLPPEPLSARSGSTWPHSTPSPVGPGRRLRW